MDGKLVLAGAFAFLCSAFASTVGVSEPTPSLFETRYAIVKADRHPAPQPPCEQRLRSSRTANTGRPAAGLRDAPAEFADRATRLSPEDAGPAADEPRRAVEFTDREQPCVAALPLLEPAAELDRTPPIRAAAGDFNAPEPASWGMVLAGAAAFLAFRRLRR